MTMHKRVPRLLDLYCGAGGAGMGYHMAGFKVVGVDINPQPRYPFRFLQRDVIDLDPDQIRRRFDAIHASPPCQAHSVTRSLHPDSDHPDLVPETRELLRATGLPYVIENVPGAPLEDPVMLCGSTFGLRVRRHRLFECSFDAVGLACEHGWQKRHQPYRPIAYHMGRDVRRSGTIGVFGRGQGLGPGESVLWKVAMGIDWMTKDELAQAIPPAYTKFLGAQLYREVASA